MCASAAADADLRASARWTATCPAASASAQTVMSERLFSLGHRRLYWDDEGRCTLCPETAEEVARSGSVSGVRQMR